MPRISADKQSREVAVVAARIMQEQGLDFLAAKKKAALKLGLGERAALPTNRQVEEAMLEHQRLFFDDAAQETLVLLREAALEVMHQLANFDPRLVGAVLSGAITAGTAVELHAFTDSPEAVAVNLIDRNIDYRLVERRIRVRAEQYELTPVYCFVHNDIDIDVYVFSLNGQRQSPLSPVDGKPMIRAPHHDVQDLLEHRRSVSVIEDFFSEQRFAKRD